jgi:hypothetical protein
MGSSHKIYKVPRTSHLREQMKNSLNYPNQSSQRYSKGFYALG